MPVILAALLALALAATGAGQRLELSAFAGASQVRENSLGAAEGGEELSLDSGFRTGVRLATNRGAFVGHELSYGFARHDLEAEERQEATVRVHQLHYNFLLHLTPQKVAVRPFVTAGAGLSRYAADPQRALRAQSKPGANYGGGLKLRLGKTVGARFDVRDHFNAKPALRRTRGLQGRLHSVEYSAGVSLLF